MCVCMLVSVFVCICMCVCVCSHIIMTLHCYGYCYVCCVDHCFKPLPKFPRCPETKLSGPAFSDSLMVVEFVHNFADALGLGKSIVLLELCVCSLIHCCQVSSCQHLGHGHTDTDTYASPISNLKTSLWGKLNEGCTDTDTYAFPPTPLVPHFHLKAKVCEANWMRDAQIQTLTHPPSPTFT